MLHVLIYLIKFYLLFMLLFTQLHILHMQCIIGLSMKHKKINILIYIPINYVTPPTLQYSFKTSSCRRVLLSSEMKRKTKHIEAMGDQSSQPPDPIPHPGDHSLRPNSRQLPPHLFSRLGHRAAYHSTSRTGKM